MPCTELLKTHHKASVESEMSWVLSMNEWFRCSVIATMINFYGLFCSVCLVFSALLLLQWFYCILKKPNIYYIAQSSKKILKKVIFKSHIFTSIIWFVWEQYFFLMNSHGKSWFMNVINIYCPLHILSLKCNT